MDQDTLKRFTTSMILCMGLLFAWQYFNSPKKDDQPAKQDQQQSSTDTENASKSSDDPATLTAPTGQWSLVAVPETRNVTMGSLDSKDGYDAQIIFDSATGSVSQVLLNQYKYKIDDEANGYPVLNPIKDADDNIINSFMLEKMTIEGLTYPFMLNGKCWKTSQVTTGSDGTQSVSFTATVNDGDGKAALEIIKNFSYKKNDHEIDFSIKLVNKSTNSIDIKGIKFYGPAGVLREDSRTDSRAVTLGLLDEDNEFDTTRSTVKDLNDKKDFFGTETLTLENNQKFRWYSVGNKYFAAGLRPKTYEDDNALYLSEGSILAQGFILNDPPEKLTGPINTFGFSTKLKPAKTLDAGKTVTFDFAAYVGPVERQFFKEAKYAGLNYDQMTTTRSCACCTFGFLQVAVVGLLDGIHKVIPNYGIAVIFMVLLVRLLLHPISKKSQVNMMSMSKLGPKVEEIKKKYAGNPQEIQKQTMLIYREQGFTPILGCLPMLLQMPIWIALFTTVSTHIPLRHSGMFPASFGWLNDLSAPDKLIAFSSIGIPSFNFPLVGEVNAVNLLPILLGVAMFLQMKYSPQSNMQTQTNPQAAQQQKMMMWMMPIMMFVMFYNGSSGLNLYIMASTFAGLIEQHFIRKHIKEKEAMESLAGPSKNVIVIDGKAATKIGEKKKKPKPPFKMK
ncbi:MAG: YidC/Oxa1 family insertase periplasmic-domain containing protein [Phycisphaerae bacterium]|nr:YidC/Oxa1 family insertase periplasmic-domain containing protein [Phycisphaerae bacterium]